MEPLRDVRLNLPVIVMDGAALFHLAEKRYERVYVISPEYSRRIMSRSNFIRERMAVEKRYEDETGLGIC